MHELSLCLNMLKILEQQAQLKKFNFIKTIWLEMGMLAGVEKDALLFSFPIAAKNTIAANAQLNIIDVPGQAKCQHCQVIVKINTYFAACPYCNQVGLEMIGGTELRIRDVEVV